MKKYRYRKLTRAAFACMAAMSLAACGTAADTTTTAETTAEETTVAYQNTAVLVDDEGNETTAPEGTFTGCVKEIDGNTITVKAYMSGDSYTDYIFANGGGDMGDMEKPDDDFDPSASGNSDESVPEKPSGETDSTGTTAEQLSFGGVGNTDGSASEQASGDMGGNAPEKPSGDMGGSADGNGAPEMPSGDMGNMDGNAPEKPSGDMSGSADGNGAPEMPSGDMGNMDGSAPEQPSGDMGGMGGNAPGMTGSNMSSIDADEVEIVLTLEDSSLIPEDLKAEDMITVTVDENGNVTAIDLSAAADSADIGNGGGQPGGSSTNVSYSAVTTYDDDTEESGETYTSTGTDENAILVENGAEVTLDDVTVSRTSSDSTGGDNSSFYGVGAAVLATDGTLTINGGTIETDADGGAGVFAYGDGVVYANDLTITTTEDTSGGIHVAGGGTLYANNCTVETNGESSAAIRSDRGGGTMVVDGGSYTSNGVGSPAIYCTADITVSNAVLEATGSEAVCIEGLNSLTLTDCDLTGNMSDSSQNDCTWNVILYQSMSGDSEVGNSSFTMEGGTLTAGNGGMFYTTNTESSISLSNVEITYSDDNPFFLQCTGNSNERGWGSSGSNGAQCTFTADDQEMTGDVIWDSISTLDFTMENGSVLTGAVLDDETWAGNGGSGYCNMTIDSTSKWIVTGDSTLTELNAEGQIVDENGNTVTITGTDGTVYVQGTSQVTVTVDSYSDSVD